METNSRFGNRFVQISARNSHALHLIKLPLVLLLSASELSELTHEY